MPSLDHPPEPWRYLSMLQMACRSSAVTHQNAAVHALAPSYALSPLSQPEENLLGAVDTSRIVLYIRFLALVRKS